MQHEVKLRRHGISIWQIPDHEEGYILNPDNTVFLHRVGQAAHIDFSDKLKVMTGKTMTHNHPVTKGSMSMDDVGFAANVGVVEMRAVEFDNSVAPIGDPPDNAFLGDQTHDIVV